LSATYAMTKPDSTKKTITASLPEPLIKSKNRNDLGKKVLACNKKTVSAATILTKSR
jgi:hypothetical protein